MKQSSRRAGDKPSTIGFEKYEVLVSGQVWQREYGYFGERLGALREYRLKRAPALGVRLGWSPLLVTDQEVSGKLGLRASYATLLQASSTINGTQLATDSQAWQLGLRAGTIIRGTVELGFALDYGEHAFWVADTYLPDPHYRYTRPGLYARINLGRLSIEAAFGSRFLLHTGQLSARSWFPQARGVAADGELGASLRVIGPIGLAAGGTWTRYPVTINAPLNHQNHNGVAEGLIDLYVSLWGGIQARF